VRHHGNNASFSAKVFIDATYEGDLMAFSGVSYNVGREPETQYNEPSAGVREGSGSQSAFDDNGKLLPGVLSRPPGPIGSGDNKTQSYNFRLSLTNDKNNQAPFPKPENYDPGVMWNSSVDDQCDRTDRPAEAAEKMVPA